MASSDAKASALTALCYITAAAVLASALRSNRQKHAKATSSPSPITTSSKPSAKSSPKVTEQEPDDSQGEKDKQPDQPPGEFDHLLYQFKPIGVCRSIFAEKWGTPRQGALAPNTRGHFKLYPTVAHTALQGIEQFSHVWVIFVFSENTNSTKENKFVSGPKNFTFPAKIKPPLLMGRTTGIFSTR
jgi:hypothetical protein